MSDYFYNAIRRDIVMIKNDTMSFAFQVQGLGGQTPDNIIFTCKETPDKDTALFSVDLGNHITERSYDSEHDIRTYTLRIPPELTENVEAGRYFYDIQFTVNRDILTLMKGRLTVEYQITGGSVEPEPDYENGDLVKYPLVGIPLGTIKLYTEQYISDIASWINTILVDPNGRYTTQEMSGALSDINDYLLALSAALKTALSDQSPDDIPLPEMPATMTVINGDISDINDAINSITGGSGNIPLSDMAAIIGTCGYTEELTIIFAQSMIGETWTVTDGVNETYTGTVDNTQMATVTLTQTNTEYTISCAGVSAVFTSHGYASFNLGSASLIILSMESLAMIANTYTDTFGLTYVASASSERFDASCAFNGTKTGDGWRPSSFTSPGWLMLHVPTPCKVKKHTLSMSVGNQQTTVLFQGSNDGTTFYTLNTIEIPQSAGSYDIVVESDPFETYTYYRWYYQQNTGTTTTYIQEITFTKITV